MYWVREGEGWEGDEDIGGCQNCMKALDNELRIDSLKAVSSSLFYFNDFSKLKFLPFHCLSIGR